MSELRKYCLEWLVPALIGVLFYSCIKKIASTSNLYDVSGYLMAASAVVYLNALGRGKSLQISAHLRLPLIVLAASLCISTLASSSLQTSLSRLYLYAALCFFAISIYLIYRDRPGIKIEGFFVAIAALHVFFLTEIVFWILSHDGPVFRQSLRVPNFSNMRHFGYLGFLAASCGTGLLALSKKLDITSLTLVILALFGIILLGSRGALLSWLLFVGLLLWKTPRRGAVLVYSLIALLLASVAVYELHAANMLVTPNLFVRAEAGFGDADPQAGRIAVWLQSLRAILSNPVFGLGPEGFRLSRCCNPLYVQPHNLVLQFLLEFGLCGLAALIFLLFRTTKALGGFRLLRARVQTSCEGTVLSCLVFAYIAYALIDGLFYHVAPLLHFALLSGLLAAQLHLSSRAPDVWR